MGLADSWRNDGHSWSSGNLPILLFSPTISKSNNEQKIRNIGMRLQPNFELLHCVQHEKTN
jgi:hypothetical protein